MKKILIAVFSLCILFFAAISYAQQFSDWQKGVFYDVVEKWHALLYTQGGNYVATTTDFNYLYQEVAYKYNVTADEVKKVDNDILFALTDAMTKSDFAIVDDLYKSLNAMPASATRYDAERVHNEIASKYGISLHRLIELEYLDQEGMLY